MSSWSVPVIGVAGAIVAAVALGPDRLPPTKAPSARDAATVVSAPTPRAVVAASAAPGHRVVALLDVRDSDATHRSVGHVASVEVRAWESGRRWRVPLPGSGPVQDARFTADGEWLLLEVAEADGLHLWTVSSKGGTPERLNTPPLAPSGGAPCDWDSTDRLVLCRVIAPTSGTVPGPHLSQLTLISLDSGGGMTIGPAGNYDVTDLSPGGQYLLVGRAETRSLEVWDTTGAVVRQLGRRAARAAAHPARWDPNRPARLAWLGTIEEPGGAEALWVADAPFHVAPVSLMKTGGRLEMLSWSGDGSLIVTERRPGDTSRLVTWAFEHGDGSPREIWHR